MANGLEGFKNIYVLIFRRLLLSARDNGLLDLVVGKTVEIGEQI